MVKQHPLGQPTTALAGVGGRIAKLLEKLGIIHIQDLLFLLPTRYEDRTRLLPIAKLSAGMTALICGQVQFIEVLPRGRKSLICRIVDASGTIDLRFFHFTARQHATFKPGVKLACFGEVRYGYAGLEMVHPECSTIASDDKPIVEANLTPIYPLTDGLSQNIVRKAVKQALALCDSDPLQLIDALPESILAQNSLPILSVAIKSIHNPSAEVVEDTSPNGLSSAIRRLAFEELLTHHLSLKIAKQKAKRWYAPQFRVDSALILAFTESLPFKLTAAQLRVISEITADLVRPHPMLRLVQGDVGSGKTIVAAVAALLALESGYQVAIMAPTELLAEQHHRNFSHWFNNTAKQIVLLTGQSRGNARKELSGIVSDGSAGIVIGTHALFQDDINFNSLGLIIIDEQHRFGVHQRLALRAKGEQGTLRPHQMVMTATPIPRTLAMLQYADVDISVIDQLPPGRKPVITSVIPSERRDEVNCSNQALG